MSTLKEVQAVTGPFSYTGKYIAKHLRKSGISVRGLVRMGAGRSTDGIDCRQLQFENLDALTDDLRGCRLLYNTYWIRLEQYGQTFDQTVRNTGILAAAAKRAGVEKIVHISVSNPDVSSPFAYFRGKARAEHAILDSGVTTSVIRPTLVFGYEDILINNITWLLRHVHAFAVPASGRYRVQPVFVEDVARLAVEQSVLPDSTCLDAAGPETMPFLDLVKLLRSVSGSTALILRMPAVATVWAGQLLGRLLRDTLIIDEELGALMAETLISHQPVTASTKFSEWLRMAGHDLGIAYHSETARHWQRNQR